MSKPDAPWYAIAKKEIGVHETPGTASTDRIIEYDACTSLKATDDSVAWCSAFCNWCMVQAKLRGTHSAAARSWLDWGHVISEPIEGCIVVFKRPPNPTSGHVAFYSGNCPDPAYLQCLGGNQSDCVKYSNFHIGEVLGYRWPTDSTDCVDLPKYYNKRPTTA